MLPTVSLQKRRVMYLVTCVLDEKDEQSMHMAHGVQHVLISLLCRTPTFVSKGTKETPLPQEAQEDAMDKDGESAEEDSPDSYDNVGNITVFGSRIKGESIEKYEEEELPTQRKTRCC